MDFSAKLLSSRLQGHFLEVAPSPPDNVPQEEDGAVGMLRAIAAGLQVGLIVGWQHIHLGELKLGEAD